MRKLGIKKNDTILVITGAEKGKKGKVLATFPETRRVIVQNVNMHVHHQKARQQGEEGGLINREVAINASNVMLVCPSCNKPTRLAYKIEDGKKVRVCKHCGKNI